MSSERDDEGEVVELRRTIVVVQRVRAGPTSSVRDVQRVRTTTERRHDWTQHRLRDARTTGQRARRQCSTRRTVVALRRQERQVSEYRSSNVGGRPCNLQCYYIIIGRIALLGRYDLLLPTDNVHVCRSVYRSVGRSVCLSRS